VRPFPRGGDDARHPPADDRRWTGALANVHFCTLARNRVASDAFERGQNWNFSVVGKHYLRRQMATLLNFAGSINNRDLTAALLAKAADLQSRADMAPDKNPAPPDVAAGEPCGLPALQP
jgi:hypothetical protein